MFFNYVKLFLTIKAMHDCVKLSKTTYDYVKRCLDV